MPSTQGQDPRLYAGDEEYRDLLRRLTPRGPYWERILGDTWVALLWGLAGVFAHLHARVNQLLTEADPRTADETLAAWEEMAGLPDPAAGSPGTVEQRRLALHAHITAQGGQSASYFEGVAANLGIDVEVTSVPYRPFRVNVNRAGDRLYDGAWCFVWRVTVGGAGPNARLEALFERLKPAHTLIEFVYAA